MTSRKRKNVKLRRELKSLPCVICGSTPSDPCHVRTFKVTQSDHPANIISMCRTHHQEQHRVGWTEFLDKYPKVTTLLQFMGWEIAWHPFHAGKLIMTHPEVA